MGAQLNSRAGRQLVQAYASLGLKPGASNQDVEAAYFTRRAELAAQEDGEQQLQRLERAVRFIKVSSRFADRKRTVEETPVPTADQLERSLRFLGLSPGATNEDVDAAMAAVKLDTARTAVNIQTRATIRPPRVRGVMSP